MLLNDLWSDEGKEKVMVGSDPMGTDKLGGANFDSTIDQ